MKQINKRYLKVNYIFHYHPSNKNHSEMGTTDTGNEKHYSYFITLDYSLLK